MMRRDRDRFPSYWGRYWDTDVFNNSFDSDLPAVNVKENNKEYLVEIAAIGFDKEDFNLEINKNLLSISGKKEMKNEEKDDGNRVLRQEFRTSSFARSFTLPENVDTENIKANQKNGVLTITIPKMEKTPENSKRKIDIL